MTGRGNWIGAKEVSAIFRRAFLIELLLGDQTGIGYLTRRNDEAHNAYISDGTVLELSIICTSLFERCI